MAVIAKLKYLHIAPRKVRLVADLVRGKTIEEAQTILNFTAKRACKPLSKLLKSVVANAKNDFQLEESGLYISKIVVDAGPKNKRWRARARGQAFEIQKRTSHITVVVEEINKQGERVKKIQKPKKAEKAVGADKAGRVSKLEKPKIKPKTRKEIFRPKMEKAAKKMFRRKAF